MEAGVAPWANQQAGVSQQLVALAFLHLLHSDDVAFNARLVAEVDEVGAAVG